MRSLRRSPNEVLESLRRPLRSPNELTEASHKRFLRRSPNVPEEVPEALRRYLRCRCISAGSIYFAADVYRQVISPVAILAKVHVSYVASAR